MALMFLSPKKMILAERGVKPSQGLLFCYTMHFRAWLQSSWTQKEVLRCQVLTGSVLPLHRVFLVQWSRSNTTGQPSCGAVFGSPLKMNRLRKHQIRDARNATRRRESFWCLGQKKTGNPIELEMLGSIMSRLASPRKILGEKKMGEKFFEHSGWHQTTRNAFKKVKVGSRKNFWRWKKK